MLYRHTCISRLDNRDASLISWCLIGIGINISKPSNYDEYIISYSKIINGHTNSLVMIIECCSYFL